jgi:hypothetical protein
VLEALELLALDEAALLKLFELSAQHAWGYRLA